MPTMTKSRARQRVRLQEHVQSPPGRIDRAAGIIYGVKVCGLTSQNRRSYAERALRDAVPLYEGVRVNVDHPSRKDPHGERRFVEGFGILRAVHFEPNRGLFADLHFSTAHPLAGHVLECAEKFPNSFGLSHNAAGETVRRNGRDVVESISDVVSVDIVASPASTEGLFESTGGQDPRMAGQAVIREITESWDAAVARARGDSRRELLETSSRGGMDAWNSRVRAAEDRLSRQQQPQSRQHGSVISLWEQKADAARAKLASTGRR